MFITEVNIYKMFSAYVYRDSENQYYNFREETIYCGDCHQKFSVLWRRTGYMGYGSWDGNAMYCPKCGKFISDRGDEICYIKKGEQAPLNMNIRLDEYKDHVCLTVAGKGIQSETHGAYWLEKPYKEVFRFDIKARKTIFKKVNCKIDEMVIELGNPLEREIFNESILLFLYSHLSIRDKQSDIRKILKKLREVILRKLSAKMGYQIKSMYVSSGSIFGSMLLPIFNIAYRIVCTDLVNLSEEWREDASYKTDLIPLLKEKNFDLMIMRKAKDSISGLMQIGKLPDQPALRRMVQDNPFDFMIIAALNKTFRDTNNVLTGYAKIKNLQKNTSWQIDIEKICKGLKSFSKIYKDKDLLRLLELEKDASYYRVSVLRDIFNMYDNIGDESRRQLKQEKIRIRDLHDWLVEKNKKEKYPICRFKNDDPARKRLAMQTERINFFIPNHSDDLKYAGDHLHNCVATYIKNVRDGETHIVLVTNDYGKLTACIEVSRGKIRQAKLNRNRSVKYDAKINAEIVEWAEKVGVDWQCCTDIRKVMLPVLVLESA